MSARTLHWSESDVAWHGIVDAGHGVPFRTQVFIFHTHAQLSAACGHPDANGWSQTFNEPDADNVGALVFLVKTELWVSIIAHEAAHIALFHHGRQIDGRIGARKWAREHPEELAVMIGNLTSLIWCGVPVFNEGEAQA
ncbi:hypothetical protein F6W69_10590 [Microbacterium oxydans]|uniref:hypothetical protein n=1 Tax=Microbacterium oxydans TaxID=82380 RepID=UPI0011451889|nr:hypothetical protein [Microbacterium oxydans]KAB1891036.1 hypothetical protein F6W69_10590 [Microbacterium oxydans]GED39102.1 hypothetical protein MOX01_22440 [Microbacterium oxydans]